MPHSCPYHCLHCCLTLALTTACSLATLTLHCSLSALTLHYTFVVLTCMFLMFDCVTFTGSETLSLKQQTRKSIGWKRCSDDWTQPLTICSQEHHALTHLSHHAIHHMQRVDQQDVHTYTSISLINSRMSKMDQQVTPLRLASKPLSAAIATRTSSTLIELFECLLLQT